MDEHQTSQSNSSDADIHASDELSNSIIGKVKRRVSQILPDSLSKWLSPKTDLNNSRRRRYEEIDSDNDNTELDRNNLISSPFTSRLLESQNNNSITGPVSNSPPNKKQRLYSTTLNRSQLNSYSHSTSMLSSQRNIVSSTLLEDARTYNNRTPTPLLPHENGQDVRHQNTVETFERSNHNDMQNRNQLSQPMKSTISRSERNEDDSASVSHDKPTNPFASSNNNSTVINFAAHLQKSKSLFSNKSYLSSSSRSLSNYRMRRQPSYSSSLYRSTSSLCDNNSTSSNASSVLPSPFYNGQTAFGGASASSKRFSNAFQPDMQLQSQHRSKVPSKLIPSNLSKSTSSLNSTEQGCLSTTAKRILDLMNQFNTPLADVRRVSSGLPLRANSTLSGQKGAALLDVDTTIGATETDKFKRKLLKPNTPYNRPAGRTATEPCGFRELNVPSMSQLLQLKKLSKNTMQARELASKSNSILNQPEECKLPNTVSSFSNDLEVTNNNNNIDMATGSKHVNKIRTNIIKSRTKLKDANEEPPPEPINLPNIQLAFDKDKGISFSTASLAKPTTSIFNSTIFKPKEQISSADLTLKINETTSKTIFGTKEPSKKSSAETIIPIKYPSNYSFADPVIVTSSKSKQTESLKIQEKVDFKFTDPIFVVKKSTTDSNVPSHTKPIADIKFESHIKSRSSITSTSPTSIFGAVNKAVSSSLEPIKPVETSKGVSGFAFGSPLTSTNNKIADATAKPKTDDVFKNLVAKQNQDTWECSSCLSRNNSSLTACAACGCQNTAVKKPTMTCDTSSSKTAVVDDVFKKIAAQQKAGSWECGSCATRNNLSQIKCLCCNEPQPSTSKQIGSSSSSIVSPVTGAKTTEPKPAADDLFKAIAAKQKSSTWICTACETRNDVTKSKCVCCEQARETTTSNDSVSATQPTTTSTAGQFSFGFKTNASQFTFGNVSAASTKTAEKSTNFDTNRPSTSESKFTFGIKTTSTPSTSLTTSVTVQSSVPQFSFGNNKTEAVAKTPSTELSLGNSSNTQATTSSTATFIFGNAGKTVTSTLASQPSFSFGSPSSLSKTTSAITTTSTSTPAGLFSFGNKAVTTTTAATTVTTTAEPQKTETVASVPVDDVFKKIVAEQKAKWECQTCMTKNDDSKDKCVACETPKSGDSSSDKKEISFNAKPQFSFGSSSTQFNFGNLTKPTSSGTEAPTASTNLFQFGTANKISTDTKPGSTTENKTTSLPSFSSFASTSAPSFTLPTEATTSAAPSATTTATQPIGGFRFTFGSPASVASEKPSTDTTDGSTIDPQKPLTGSQIKVLENILIKPATNGPEAQSPSFTFGSNNTDSQRIAQKRSMADTFLAPDEENADFPKFKTPSSTNLFSSTSTPSFGSFGAPSANTPSPSFFFGQSNLNTSAFSSPISAPVNTTASPVVVPKSTFAFGNVNSSTASVAATPPTFSFNAVAANQTSPFATQVTIAGSAPVFGGNSFTMPSNPLGGGSFKTNSFGYENSPAAPTFGNPNPAANLNSTESTPALFQFGASTGAATDTIGSQSAKEAFVFSANAPPSFNFSSVGSQQANIPFQFNSGADPNVTATNIFAPQQLNSHAIQQRRKLRPIRRNVRP